MKQRKVIKIVYILLIIMILEFSIPHISNGAFTGILTKPICFLFVTVTDGINILLSSLAVPPGTNLNDLNAALEHGLPDDKAGANILMSPDKIFANKVTLLNANIFKEDSSTGTLKDILKKGDTSLAAALKKTVSNIYVLLRNISALILLCLLIYTGIRILLITASPYDQAKWKQALIDWVKALCLLMFMHIILVGVFYISDLLVDTIGNSFGDISIAAMIRNGFSEVSVWDGTGAVIVTILYIYVTFLTIVFFIAYFKRLVWIIILIVISPIVAITGALGGSQKQIFSKWFKEYVGAVIIQPFHMLIFYVLVAIPLSGITQNNASGGILDTALNNLSPFNQTSIAVHLYVLMAISMIRPAEKFLMKLLIGESSVANQASTESGMKTIHAAEKVVKDTVVTGFQIAGAVASGGATATIGAAGNMSKIAQGIGADKEGTEIEEAENDEVGTPGNSILDNEIAKNAGEKSNLQDTADWLIDNDMMTDEMMQKFADKETELTSKGNLLSSIKNDANSENKANGVDKLEQAADKLSEAAEALKEGINGFDISDKEFDKLMGDQSPIGKNKLMDRLESNSLYNYVMSPNGQEQLNELRAGAHELTDSLYLNDAGQEWKNGPFGHDKRKEEIDQKKKDALNAFVNNSNNISYMKQTHGLSTEGAKKRLQDAEPYVNRGITDVGAIDKFISAQKEGRTPYEAIKAVAKETKVQSNINQTVNDQSKINTVAQIIASSTGSRADSPKVQQQARQTMESARPYIAKGEKDPEVLHRLVELENRLKNANAGPNIRTPDKVMRMDKIIDKALKDGLNKVNLKTDQSNSQATKQLGSIMNKELRDRKNLGSNNQN